MRWCTRARQSTKTGPLRAFSSTDRVCIPCRGVCPEGSARVRPANPGAALRVAPSHLLCVISFYILFRYSREIFHSNKSIHSLHRIHRSNLGHRNLAKRAKKCEEVRASAKRAKKGIRALHAPNGRTQGMHGVYTRHAWPLLRDSLSLSCPDPGRSGTLCGIIIRPGAGTSPKCPGDRDERRLRPPPPRRPSPRHAALRALAVKARPRPRPAPGRPPLARATRRPLFAMLR